MRGADADNLGKPEGREIRLAVVVLRGVQLVDHENHRERGTAQFRRQFPIKRQEPVLAIHHEEHDIGIVRASSAARCRLGEIGVGRSADAARIHDANGDRPVRHTA